MSSDEAAAPLLRVVRGQPTAEELAALVTVVSAVAAAGGPAEPFQAADSSHWSAPSRLHRAPVSPGNVGNWWASSLPR